MNSNYPQEPKGTGDAPFKLPPLSNDTGVMSPNLAAPVGSTNFGMDETVELKKHTSPFDAPQPKKDYSTPKAYSPTSTSRYEDAEPEYEPVRRKKSGSGMGFSIFTPFRLVWSLLTNFKRLLTWGCTGLILFVIVLIVTVIFKPDATWKPLKSFLNKSLTPPVQSEMTIETLYLVMNSQLEINGKIELTQSQVATLLGQKLDKGSEVRAEITDSQIIVYVNTDEAELPLWLKITLSVDEASKVQLSSVGYSRITLPQSITGTISNNLGKVLGFINRDDLTAIADELIDSQKLNNAKPLRATIQNNLLVVEY